MYTILENSKTITTLMSDHLATVDRLRDTPLDKADFNAYSIAYKAIMDNVDTLSTLTAKKAKKADFDALAANLAKACIMIAQSKTKTSIVYDEVDALFYKTVNYVYGGDNNEWIFPRRFSRFVWRICIRR